MNKWGLTLGQHMYVYKFQFAWKLILSFFSTCHFASLPLSLLDLIFSNLPRTLSLCTHPFDCVTPLNPHLWNICLLFSLYFVYFIFQANFLTVFDKIIMTMWIWIRKNPYGIMNEYVNCNWCTRSCIRNMAKKEWLITQTLVRVWSTHREITLMDNDERCHGCKSLSTNCKGHGHKSALTSHVRHGHGFS